MSDPWFNGLTPATLRMSTSSHDSAVHRYGPRWLARGGTRSFTEDPLVETMAIEPHHPMLAIGKVERVYAVIA